MTKVGVPKANIVNVGRAAAAGAGGAMESTAAVSGTAASNKRKRVYVPKQRAGQVSVVDPELFKI
jgi:hypothetical protein